MYTALILAGGSSVRMGSDKAFLGGGVARLCSELKKGECNRIIVLCGDESRKFIVFVKIIELKPYPKKFLFLTHMTT